MFYSDDPAADADRYYTKQEEALKECPICEDCGEPIQEYGYHFGDFWICEDCIESYRKRVF